MEHEIANIIEPYKGKKGTLIPILQDIQNEFGYISQEAISILGKEIKIHESEIYGVASFYTQFRFTKPGIHQIRVCLGTACHVRGGADLMETVERELDIEHGETTDDGLFSLERVACLGCCALSPVMVVGDDIYGKLATTKVKDILKKYEERGD
jgi:NADH-quinone oxidoreductase subunit E